MTRKFSDQRSLPLSTLIEALQSGERPAFRTAWWLMEQARGRDNRKILREDAPVWANAMLSKVEQRKIMDAVVPQLLVQSELAGEAACILSASWDQGRMAILEQVLIEILDQPEHEKLAYILLNRLRFHGYPRMRHLSTLAVAHGSGEVRECGEETLHLLKLDRQRERRRARRRGVKRPARTRRLQGLLRKR